MTDVTLHLGDCLEYMKTMDAGSVDAIITDLPYGTTACSWDEIIPFEPMWECVRHVLKPRGVFVTTASQPFTSRLVCSNLDWFKYEWGWKKTKGSNFLHVKNMPLKIIENIVVFSSAEIGHAELLGNNRMNYYPQGVKKSKVFVKQNKNKSELKYHRETQTNHTIGYMCQGAGYPTSLLEIKSEPYTVHPTQKPVALYEYLIRTYTNPGDTVLDFCMGSGTTGVAAIRTGRNFKGSETDTGYFAIAEKRIAEATLQPALFQVDATPKEEQKELL